MELENGANKQESEICTFRLLLSFDLWIVILNRKEAKFWIIFTSVSIGFAGCSPNTGYNSVWQTALEN